MSSELQNVEYRPCFFHTTGVYRLQVGGYFYIGSSIAVGARRSEHVLALKRKEHRIPKLQAAWDSGAPMKFIIVQETRPKSWDKKDDGRARARLLEDQEIKKHFGSEYCCNLSDSAYCNSEIGEAARRKWMDPEYRSRQIARIRESRKIPISDECRRKMALAKTGARNVKSRSCTLTYNGKVMNFVTGTEAAKHFGVSQQIMHLWLTGQCKWSGVGRTPKSIHARSLIGLRGAYDYLLVASSG
jgi:hypothetical protein